MSVMEPARPDSRSFDRYDQNPLARYYRIHKRFVGPKTAELLLRLSDDLATHWGNEERYAAAWARAEASIVASDRPKADRIVWLSQAETLWRSVSNPNQAHCTQERRAQLCIATVPFFRAILTSSLTRPVVDTMYESYLAIATDNAVDLIQARMHGEIESYGMEIGFAHECNALLAINRLRSTRTVAIPSSARSDTGHFHRQQTHDLDILQLRRGRLQKATPMEVKARAKQKDMHRYEPALVHGRVHLYVSPKSSPTDTLELFYREATDRAQPHHVATLDRITDSVMHLMSHYHRSEEFGRHCVRIAQCPTAPASVRLDKNEPHGLVFDVA